MTSFNLDYYSEGELKIQIESQFKVEFETTGTFKKGEHSIILIDGLDEMHPSERESLFCEVTKWIGQGSSVLSTARSIDALPDQYVADYEPFTIEHLNDKQAIEIIKKWSQESQISGLDSLLDELNPMLKKSGQWIPGDRESAFSSPFYLVQACKYFVDKKEFPKKRLEVFEKIVNDDLENIESKFPGVAEETLIKIAELASLSSSTVSVPELDEDLLLSKLKNWTKLKGIDYKSILIHLLKTHLLVKIGKTISFGIHGLIYHYLVAKSYVDKGKISAEELKYIDRSSTELVVSMLDNDKAVNLAKQFLNLAELDHPLQKSIALKIGKIDPRLAYYALSPINELKINLVKPFVISAKKRLNSKTDGPTRWMVVEMLASLEQYPRYDASLVDAMEVKKSDEACIVAEAVCWLGHKRSAWRPWALKELNRIISLPVDFHPLLHVSETIERLGMSNSIEAHPLLEKLSENKDVAVSFDAVSQLAQDRAVWNKKAIQLFQWIKQHHKSRNFVICHGYYRLHWLNHPTFGYHEAVSEGRKLVMEQIENFCTDKDIPPYWIWYLGSPIIRLGLLEKCHARIGKILNDESILPDDRRLIRNFVSSVQYKQHMV